MIYGPEIEIENLRFRVDALMQLLSAAREVREDDLIHYKRKFDQLTAERDAVLNTICPENWKLVEVVASAMEGWSTPQHQATAAIIAIKQHISQLSV